MNMRHSLSEEEDWNHQLYVDSRYFYETVIFDVYLVLWNTHNITLVLDMAVKFILMCEKTQNIILTLLCSIVPHNKNIIFLTTNSNWSY